jgi:hypothetical protein
MMTASPPFREAVRGSFWIDAANRPDIGLLRTVVVAVGLSWSVAFVVIGLGYELELFGDGSIFSYSVAVDDAWAIHWHNISGRVSVYLFSILPAEIYVELTKDAHGAIVLYGLLHFVAPLLGLLTTWAADRSKHHIIFVYACLSTALLCPLVFGFPTEMWIAQALFWPALVICHYGRDSIGGSVLSFVVLLALAFTHEGGLVFIAAIVMSILIRQGNDASSVKGIGAVLVVMSIWLLVKLLCPPDSYYAPVFTRAALHFFDATIFENELTLLLFGTIASYLLVYVLIYGMAQAKTWIFASLLVTIALATYWLSFDQSLHATNRYYMRTALVIVTPVLGMLAVTEAFKTKPLRLSLQLPWLGDLLAAGTGRATTRAFYGFFFVITLVYTVETIKFVAAWNSYKAAVRGLAMGAASDRNLGDINFVSSTRIDANLNRPSWNSTTPYLSVLMAPRFSPKRLVVDPAANYFWLACDMATANLDADRAISKKGRELVRSYSCLHR